MLQLATNVNKANAFDSIFNFLQTEATQSAISETGKI